MPVHTKSERTKNRGTGKKTGSRPNKDVRQRKARSPATRKSGRR